MPNALAAETSPYLRQHAENPVDWLPWGPAGAERARERGQAAAGLDRLLVLSLVPCDGARVLRGPAHGGADERELRVREGRPRGAPGRRRAVHGGRPGDDRTRRLAAERVPHARAAAVLRRNLLPARARATGCPHGRRCCRRSPRPGASAARRSAPAASGCASSSPAERGSHPRAEPIEAGELDAAVAKLRSPSTRATAASAARRSSRRRR